MSRLRAARIAAGLTTREAARLAGIAPAYLDALERRGASGLTWPRAQRLAKLYNVDPIALLGEGRSEQRKAAGRFTAGPPRQDA